MKKAIMILSALFIGMSAMAQGWDSYTLPKDEMKGRMTEQSVLRYYDTELLLCLYTDDKAIGVSVFNGIYDYYSSYGDKQVDIEVGFYDKDNNYCSKKELTFAVGSTGDAAVLVRQPQVTEAIIYWLVHEGSIRLLIPRYNDIELDVTIPQIQ